MRIQPIPSDVFEDVRTSGVDALGNPVEHVVANGGEPLRCCLRNARPGEQMILFGYEPPLPPSPYREKGAVYAHVERCAGPANATEYPADWQDRPQALRAYDSRGWIHPATRTHDGQDPEAAIAEVLAEPGVVQIHSRNLAYGCYMFTITKE